MNLDSCHQVSLWLSWEVRSGSSFRSGNSADASRPRAATQQAALAGLGHLDQAHAMVYFQLIWNGLREPMRQALEALNHMERQIEGQATCPPFVQKIIDRGRLEGVREGVRE